MKSTKLKFFVMFTAAMLGLSSVAQETPEKGWYLGVHAGLADWDDQIPNYFSGDAVESEFQFGIFGGYNFNRFFAVEGEWLDLGSLELRPNQNSGQTQKTSATGFRASAVGKLPLERLELFLKLGLFASNVDRTNGGATYSDDDGSATVSLGFNFQIAERWHAGVSFAHYELSWLDLDILGDDGANSDVEVVQLGVQYRF